MSVAPFTGFHPEAIDFFDALARDNTKAFWEAHRATYDEHVRSPLEALAASLEGLFGAAHIYRPYRDVRFSKDKRPYKTHAAVSFGGRGPGAIAGHHVHLDPDGLFVAAGAYRLDPEALAAYRRAVAEPRSGEDLETIVAALEGDGYELHGELLKRAPRGFPQDHPREALLRRKGLAVVRTWPVEPWLFTADVTDRIVRVFGDAEPLVTWLMSPLS